MNLIADLNVGNWYQNLTFYSLLVFLIYLNFYQITIRKIQKDSEHQSDGLNSREQHLSVD